MPFAPPTPVAGKVRRRTPPSHVEGATVEGRPDIVVGGQDLLDALGHEGVLRDDDVRPARDPRDPLGRACSDFYSDNSQVFNTYDLNFLTLSKQRSAPKTSRAF